MELRGEGILLRPPLAEDVDAIVAACSDDEIVRFIPMMPTPYERSDAEWWVDQCERAWQDGDACPFAIVDPARRASWARSSFARQTVRSGTGSPTMPRGRGMATRALRLVCEWRSQRPLNLVTHPSNLASQRVAEKAGFRRVGMTPHEPHFADGTTEAVRFELA
jgi:RimJ/RimL family protein N-acetyltransferase